jgi:hypothetical protein
VLTQCLFCYLHVYVLLLLLLVPSSTGRRNSTGGGLSTLQGSVGSQAHGGSTFARNTLNLCD